MCVARGPFLLGEDTQPVPEMRTTAWLAGPVARVTPPLYEERCESTHMAFTGTLGVRFCLHGALRYQDSVPQLAGSEPYPAGRRIGLEEPVPSRFLSFGAEARGIPSDVILRNFSGEQRSFGNGAGECLVLGRALAIRPLVPSSRKWHHSLAGPGAWPRPRLGACSWKLPPPRSGRRTG